MAQINAVALDVDGVLTDGTLWWGADGSEMKRFSFRDIMGISRAGRMGVIFALISGENSPLVDRFAAKLHISHVFKGCTDKAAALRTFAESNNLQLGEICFMGDDINDLEAIRLAGFSAAPCDAHKSALAAVAKVTRLPGGAGAVRELLDDLFLLPS